MFTLRELAIEMFLLKWGNVSRSISQKAIYDISLPMGGEEKKTTQNKKRTIKMFSLLDDKNYY